jgi:LuxR family transcriptional regulator of spore coat protein
MTDARLPGTISGGLTSRHDSQHRSEAVATRPVNLAACMMQIKDAVATPCNLLSWAGSRVHVIPGSPAKPARAEDPRALAAAGKTAAEIGAILEITGRTVQEHMAMAVRKLGTGSEASAIAIFLKSGLVRE